MSKPRKPWSKAKVRRVLDSLFVGGYAAYRSRDGWNVWFSGAGAGPSRRRFFIPARVAAEHPPRWLGNRLTAAMRESVEGLEGVRMIPGREAQALVRWQVRWVRHKKFEPTPAQRAKMRVYDRWYRRAYKAPQTIQRGSYSAERSRRGWVVRLDGSAGRLRGHYLVPFRALDARTRQWDGRAIFSALGRSMRAVDSARPTDDRRFAAPTIWAGMP
jgi:hypothetical protein